MPSNRPFRRSLVKLMTRLLAGPSRAHAQDAFPGLKLTLATPDKRGTILYRGKLAGHLTASSQAMHAAGKTVYIVGSGPSIEQSDLSLIEDRSAILLNGALNLLPDQIKIPLAVAIEDERFVWRHFDLFQKIQANYPCLLSVSVIRAICERDEAWLQDRSVILIDDIRKPYGAARRALQDLAALPHAILSADHTAGFSTDPDKGVFQGGSVAVSATQFALSLKPAEIGFLGIDLSNADQPRFYEKNARAYSGIVKGQPRILAHLTLAREFAVENGIRAVNYSPISALRDQGFGYSDRIARRPQMPPDPVSAA